MGPVSLTGLQAAVDDWGGGRLLDVAAAPGGNWNRTLFLSTTTGELVFKAGPPPFTGLDVEVGCARLLAREGLRVPDPILYDDRPERFGWPYALMPRLSGTVWDDPLLQETITDAEREAVASAMGRLLARVHRRRWPWMGRVSPDGVVAEEDVPMRRVRRHVQDALARLEAYLHDGGRPEAALDPASRALIANVLVQADGLGPPSDFALALTDFHERNVTFERVSGRWSPSGMFDLEGHIGDPVASLPRIISVYRDEAPGCETFFVDAWRAECPPGPAAEDRYRCFALADRLEIWLFAHSSRELWWEPGTSFADWVAPHLVAPDLR